MMKITGVDRAMQAYGNPNKVKKLETKKTPESDQMKISTHAQDFQAVLKAVRAVPDIRSEKVDKLKGEIASGSYKVDAKKVAQSMIKQAHISK